jgi:Protein of unknown function (DUF3106)
MNLSLPSRLWLGAAFILFAAAPALARSPEQRASEPPPILKPSHPAPTRADARPGANAAIRSAEHQEHLAQWMEHHQNLSLADQQRALQNEPGFREFPPQVQQRELNQLARLYNMNPRQRSRMLDRNEALERLSPPQRQQWNFAVQQLTALPLPRRRLMARAILDLREMPPQQRQQVIDSPSFRGQFSDDERSTLSTLLTAEPYPPSRSPNEAP